MKEEEQNNIDHLFSSKFEGFEGSSPSARVWDNIELELNKKENKKPLIPFLLRFLFIGVAAIGLIYSGITWKNHYSSNKAIQFNGEQTSQVDANSKESSNIVGQNEKIIGQIENKSENTELDSPIGNSKLNAKTNNSSIGSEKSTDSYALNTNERKVSEEVPAFEKTSKNKSIHRNKKVLEEKKITLEAIKAVSNESLARKEASTILFKRNNETIVLEIVGSKSVVVEEPKAEAQLEQKDQMIDFEALKKNKSFSTGAFVGAHTGLTLSSLYFSQRSMDPLFNNLSTFNTTPGYLFGINGGYDFNKRIGIQLELNYARYNYSFIQPENDYHNQGELSIFQINIPVMLRYKMNFEIGKKKNLFSLVGLAGLKYSYITKYYLAARLFSNNAKNVAFWHLDKINHDENHQLGYVLGIEANYFIKKNIYLFGGASGSVNSDISQFPIFLNNQLEKPTQLSGTVVFGIRYQFMKKGKSTK